MPEFNQNQPHKIYDGRKGDTLDKIVHDSITAGSKTMSDFTSEYPYRPEVRNDKEY